MNTIRSTWYGWGTLIVACGGAYYFAKKEINADRQARHDNERAKQQRIAMMRAQAASREAGNVPSQGTHNHKGLDHAGSPSSEASEDAAPVGHAPETNEQRIVEKSKYEAAEPYRSKKGNRFS